MKKPPSQAERSLLDALAQGRRTVTEVKNNGLRQYCASRHLIARGYVKESNGFLHLTPQGYKADEKYNPESP